MVQDIFGVFSPKNKCPNCGSVLQFGVTTEYDPKTKIEKCSNCKAILSKD